MLTALAITNVVLIESLTLEAGKGLLALTGETGAGKSILLDALGLALGNRADSGLVRHGTDQASVLATFDLPAKHPARQQLDDKEIRLGKDEPLILRRIIGKDGKSKAFINDHPVSLQLLRDTAAELVEIHGQFETQGLLNPATHRPTLDACAGLGEQVTQLHKHFHVWKSAREKISALRAAIDDSRRQEDYLRYATAELDKLSPQDGEEEILAAKRQTLMAREKMQDAFLQAKSSIDSDNGILTLIGKLQGALDKLARTSGETQQTLTDGLYRAKSEIEEISFGLEKWQSGGNAKGEKLEDIEERYFSLKEMAKKHRVTVAALPALADEFRQKLQLIEDQDHNLAALEKAATIAKTNYLAAAEKISAARAKAAQKLVKMVNAELPALKLDKASFGISCTIIENEADFGEDGIDRVQFTVATNPQTPQGPLHKIASGGELSRFMLALKVILAETGSVPTLIFDEADSGIGGATADAVGERLQRLAAKYQVLAITHSPQVAARASCHWHVVKSAKKDKVTTTISLLASDSDRREEIARMLSGAEITPEARAQAAKLLQSSTPVKTGNAKTTTHVA